MSNDTPYGGKTREQIEAELLEALRETQRDWISASGKEREVARQKFMNALHTFNSFVLYGKLPKDVD